MKAEEQKKIAESLLVGNGDSALLRAHDWAQTPLGAIETWSDDLKTAVQIRLTRLNSAQTEQVQQVRSRNCAQTTALHESEARYRTLFEWIDEGFCIIEVIFDADGKPLDHRILQANRAFERQSGIANLEGKTASELAPKIEQYWNDLYAQVVDTGESIRTEVWSEALERWFDVLVSRVGDGATRQVVVVFTDISARKRADAALRESEQRFRLMADAVPQIVWITDADGRVEFFNKQWSDYTGVPYEPTTAAVVAAKFVHPDDGAQTIEAFEQARYSGSVFSVEHRICSAAGTYRWFLVRAEPYRDPQTGEIVRWFGASIDIHDRKLAEAALRESEELKQSILDSSKDCIKVLTLNSEVVYISAGGLCLLEIDEPTDILNASWVDFWQGEDYESAKIAVAAATAGSTGQFQGQG